VNAGRKSIDRLTFLQENWGDEFINLTSYGQIFYASVDELPFAKYPVYHLPKEYQDKFDLLGFSNLSNFFSKAQLARRIISFDKCLSIPHCKWLLTFDDDSIVDLTNLQNMVSNLEMKYDPIIDPVMKGNCFFQKWIQKSFLQGGSGYILSRRACQLIIENISTDFWFYKFSYPDDRTTMNFVKILNITIADTSSSFFFGFVPNPHLKHYLMKNQFSKFHSCNFKSHYNGDCNFDYFQVNQLAVYHPIKSRKHNIFPILQNAPGILFLFIGNIPK
jgi:hypothetical protein